MSGESPRLRAQSRASMERLFQAALEGWVSVGQPGMSARTIAQSAGLPTSSIYHHFGDLDGLYVAAQDFARGRAAEWCEEQIGRLHRADLPAAGLPPLMATLIDDWCTSRRELAFAWRECRLLAARDERYRSVAHAWDRLWGEFWLRICTVFNLEEFGELTACIADSEGLYHLIAWNRAIDRCCLDELCHAWGQWLAGRLAGEGPWRRFAREQAGHAPPSIEIHSPVAETIAAAAADLLSEAGLGAITHRAVASKAQLTLGLVSYNFKSSADLMSAAFEVYRRRSGRDLDPETVRPGAAREHLVQLYSRLGSAARQDFGVEEIAIVAAREPTFAPFAAAFRYQRGLRSGPYLAALLGVDQISSTDAALYSAIIRGRMRRGCHEDEAAFLASFEHGLEQLRQLLAPAEAAKLV